ncbi:hypothetical protein BT69DRAFT_653202 [Atractiella rhizophila]|nr:hypothetical protein BT69DRAFT_653202 [Atractiella rhizophila]
MFVPVSSLLNQPRNVHVNVMTFLQSSHSPSSYREEGKSYQETLVDQQSSYRKLPSAAPTPTPSSPPSSPSNSTRTINTVNSTHQNYPPNAKPNSGTNYFSRRLGPPRPENNHRNTVLGVDEWQYRQAMGFSDDERRIGGSGSLDSPFGSPNRSAASDSGHGSIPARTKTLPTLPPSGLRRQRTTSRPDHAPSEG